MMDLVYVAATVLFFAVLLLYTAGCERLGRTADMGRAGEDAP